uniref:CSON004430 protein n=1 Tax=Culicoides sonorensis TaxID=179676 RepID=A0A336MNM9_CULSO
MSCGVNWAISETGVNDDKIHALQFVHTVINPKFNCVNWIISWTNVKISNTGHQLSSNILILA